MRISAEAVIGSVRSLRDVLRAALETDRRRMAFAGLLIGVLGLAAATAALLRPLFITTGLQRPLIREVRVTATAVATRVDTISTLRPGRVVIVRIEPGSVVEAGDGLFELEDLALTASLEGLDEEIAELQAKLESRERTSDRDGEQEVRIAALRNLEESYQAAEAEFERIRTLYEQGLLARLDFEQQEREFAAFGERLAAARSVAEQVTPTSAPTNEERQSLPLLRAERLRARLDELPRTFVVKSPWAGRVLEVHAAPGDMPERHASMATIARVALPALEARLESGLSVFSVRSACGVPGPLSFTLAEGVFRSLAPAPQLRPGDECQLTLRVRE